MRSHEKESAHAPPVLTLPVEGMSCAGCASRLARTLNAHDEIENAEVNFATESAALQSKNLTRDQITQLIEEAGFTVPKFAKPNDAGSPSLDWVQASQEKDARERTQAKQEALKLSAAAALTLPLLAPMLGSLFGVDLTLPGLWQLALATPVQVLLGARFYQGAWKSVRAGSANMDTLVALGTSAAFLLSALHLSWGGALYFESAAAIITFVLGGKWMERRARRGTTSAIRQLMELRPATARVKHGDNETEIPLENVKSGDTVVTRPGERIAVDGVIIHGASEADESLLTGEALPVAKAGGAKVIGGTLNGSGLLVIRATDVGRGSLLAQIVDQIQRAQQGKAPVEEQVDRIARIFVPAVLAVALLTFIAWWALGHGVEQAVVASVSVLVIACPCALGLATPAALVVGTGAAARAGILIRNVDALESATRISLVVFDKTGTLTAGKPRVVQVLGDNLETLPLAAAAQLGSEHLLAQAIRRAAQSSNIEVPLVSGFQALPGRGVRARVDGRSIHVGSPRMMEALGVRAPENLAAQAQHFEADGLTVAWVIGDDAVIGALVIGDSIREGAPLAIEALKRQGIQTTLLTGDNSRAAQFMGSRLGVDEIVAEALPQDKTETIVRLQKAGHVVAMVGDGVNDAPALASADVSFAMGSGSDVAMDAAAVTLMRAEPQLVLETMNVSRLTVRKIQQNLFWAFAYNIVGIPLAALGFLNPMIAGAAMALSSVSVLGNALLLKRWKPQALTQ